MQSTIQKVYYNPSIDGLRGISIAYVLAYHFFPGYFPGGFIGVDIFFVISGYLITLSYISNSIDGNYTVRSFYKARIIRLFPALFTVIFVGLLLSWSTHSSEEFYQYNKSVLYSLMFSQNWNVFFSSGYFNSESLEKPLLHLWSLSVEEQFYIFFSFLTLFISNKDIFKKLAFGLFITSFALNIYFLIDDLELLYLSPITRGWEIFSGVLLALGIESNKNRLTIIFRLKITQVLAYSLLMWGLFFIGREGGYPGMQGLIPVSASFLLIGISTYQPKNLILSNKILVTLGLISYPLYLWHWMLYSFSVNYFQDKSFLLRFTVLMTSIILAFLTFKYIENSVKIKRGKWIIILVYSWLILLFISFLGVNKVVNSMNHNSLANKISDVQYDKWYRSEWMEGLCFLQDVKDVGNFDECKKLEQQSKNLGKTIFIWGDSHAAQLYPGFKDFFPKDSVLLRSMSSCAPIVGDKPNSENCRAFNKDVLDEIKVGPVDTVVLASRWSAHDREKIVETVRELRKVSNLEVIIVGPPVHWGAYLPRILSQMIKNGRYSSLDELPKYISGYPDRETLLVDLEMSGLAYDSGAKYFSIVKLMCNSDGCINRVGPKVHDIIAFDYDHLTPNASKKLVREYYEK